MRLPQNSQRGIIHMIPLLLIVATLGLVVFLLVISTAPFSSGPLSELFKKERSNAQIPQGEFSKRSIIVHLKSPEQTLRLKNSAVAQGVSLEDRAINTDELDEQTLPESLRQIKQNYRMRTIDKIFKNVTQLENIKQNLKEQLNLSNFFVLNFDEDVPVEQIIADLKQDPAVETAEVNLIVKATQTTSPNDPYYLDSFPLTTGNRDPAWNPSFDYQWNLKKIGMGQVWSQVNSLPQVLVGVVDSGVDYTHPDFGGCTLTQVNNNQCAKIAPGADYVNSDTDAMDDYGHGTHVAGIIAASNNGVGIAGMAPNARIIPVKGLDNTGSGLLSGLASGIVFAADHGAKVINASWSATGSSSTITNAVSYAYNLGVVVTVVSGNNNDNAANYLPGNIDCGRPGGVDCTLTVAATDENDARASYSNFGQSVDVAAPGGSSSFTLLSLKSNIIIGDWNQFVVGQRYLRLAGTSMAAPHVAALVAIMLGKNPALTPATVRSTILANADDLGTVGFDTNFGNGRINVQKVLNAMTGPTPTPTPTPAQTFGLTFSPSSVNISIAQNSSKIALTVNSTTSNSFSFVGNPTSSSGISWNPASTSILIGSSRPVLLTVLNTVPVGTYTGTGVLQDNNNDLQQTFPVSVTVTAATPSPSPTPTSTPVPLTAPTVNTSALTCVPSSGYTGSGITLSWTLPAGASSVIFADISTSINFSTYYHKSVSGNSTTAPFGFTLSNGSTPLTIMPNTSYFARVWNGVVNSPPSNGFNLPACNTPTPTPTSTPTPSPTPTPTPTAAPLPGDIDGNRVVNIFDYNILVTNFGRTGSGIQGDIDNNGVVNIFDYNILVTNFGRTS